MPLSKQRVVELLRQADPDDRSDWSDAYAKVPDEIWKPFSRFLELVQEEAVTGKGSWMKAEDVDHHVRILDQALNPTQARSSLSPEPQLVDVVAQVIPVLQAGRVEVREQNLLRRVYEEARCFLRYNGIDQARASQAIDRLDDAIEKVKQFDGGTEEPT
jgi:hypothetical protein